MIILMGHIHVDPHEIDQFIADLQVIARNAKPEKGCLFYAVNPDAACPGRLVIAERWRDQSSLKAHLETSEVLDFVHNWQGRMRSEIQQYQATHEETFLC